MNKELLTKTLETIKANPQHWKQTQWHCGTCHCFAGTGELVSKGLPSSTLMRNEDSPYLDLNDNDWEDDNSAPAYKSFAKLFDLELKDAIQLFAPENTLEDLERIVNELISR